MNATRFTAAALKLLVVAVVVAMRFTTTVARAGIFNLARSAVRGGGLAPFVNSKAGASTQP
ncbi:MAG: hypothetical protein IIA67_12430 [Planctomycetes bacterium]|nr:hypothetical protein [Planctomycetota bacterium]